MALSAGSVVGYLELEDRLTPALKKASERLDKTGKKLTELGTKVQQLGSTLLPASAAAAAAIAVPVHAFASFDASLTKSLAIMGDVSSEMRGEMSDAAREVAKTTTFSANQAAESYFFLASAGLDAASSIEAIPLVSKFAQAGLFDMALATDLLTDAQSALGLTVKDDVIKNMENMARVSDVLVKANTIANATVQQFSESLTNRAGAALRLVNKEMEEGVAVLAVFADQGVKGAEAGTRLDIVLRDLQRASIKNRDEFDQFNISVYDGQGNMRNMADIVGQLEVSLAGMSDEQVRTTLMTLGFQDRSIAATASLLGFSDQIASYEKQLKTAGGITEEVAQKQLETFIAQMGLLWDRVRETAITLGSTFVPILLKVADIAGATLIPMIEWAVDVFSALPAPVHWIVLGLLALTAAAAPLAIVFGTVTTMAGLMSTGLAALTTATWLTTAAVTALKIAAGLIVLNVVIISVWKFVEALKELGGLIKDKKQWKLDALADNAVHMRALTAASEIAGKKIEDVAEANKILQRESVRLRSEQMLGYDIMERYNITLEDMMQNMHLLTQENIDAMAAAKKQAESYLGVGKAVKALTEEQEELLAQFSGAGLLKAGRDYEVVLANIGDTSKLTTEEQGEFRDVFSTIIEKYKLLGPEGARVVRHFQDLKNSIPTPTLVDFTDNLFDFYEMQIATRTQLAETSTWLDRQAEAFKSEATAEASAKLNDFYEMQIATQTELAKSSEWLDEFYSSLDETESSAGNLTITLAALAGGMGGATGQGINLALALHQSNIELDNAQKAGKRLDEEGFSPAQMGAAALGGALQDVGAAIGGVAGKFLQAAGNIAQAFATGGPVAAAIALTIESIKMLGSWIDSMVNGAQMRFNDLSDALLSSLDKIRSGALTAAEAFDRAMNWEGNEEGFDRLRETQELWVEAGLSAQEATVWVQAYQDAVNNQDYSAIRQLILDYEEVAIAAEKAAIAAELLGDPTQDAIDDFNILNEVWADLNETGQVTAEALENYTERLREARDAGIELTDAQNELVDASDAAADAADASADAAEELAKTWEATVRSITSSYRSIVLEADAARDNAIDNALAMGASQEEAAAIGSDAWLAAYEYKKQLRIIELAQEAAFSAALQQLQAGNAAGAVEAARIAFSAMLEMAGLAFDAVEQAAAAAGIALDELRPRGIATFRSFVPPARSAGKAVKDFAKDLEGLKEKLKDLNHEIRLMEINQSIDAVKAKRDAELGSMDERIDKYKALRTEVLEGINERINAIKEERAFALNSLDQQIESLKEVAAQKLKLNALDSEAAKANLIDVDATKRIAERLGLDVNTGSAYASQEASNRIVKLAEEIAVLEKAGIDVSQGASAEFDTEIQDAVSAARNFGITIPESLRDVLSTFEFSTLEFGDGLTEQSRKIEELGEERALIETEFNSQIQILTEERASIEKLYGLHLDVLLEERDTIETAYNNLIEGLTEQRNAREIAYNANIEWLSHKRSTIENKNIDTLNSLFKRRIELEGQISNHPNSNIPQRAMGSPGLNFEDWGRGTPAILHGQEAVVRSDQADDFIERHGGDEEGSDQNESLRQEVSGLRRDIVDVLIAQPVQLMSLLNTRES